MIDITNNDIIGAAIFLLPGFLSVYIASKISVYDTRQLKDHEYYLLSLFVSIVSYALVFFLENSSLNEIENKAINHQTIVYLYLCAFIIAILSGTLLKKKIHQNVKPSVASTWTSTLRNLNQKEGKYVHVFTSDGHEFMGCMRRFSGDSHGYREILLESPNIIIRNEEYEAIKEVSLGEEILLTESDIKRVLFLESTCGNQN